MPIDSSTTFDTVVISCSCKGGRFTNHWVQQGTTPIRNTSRIWIPGGGIFDVNNSEVAEVISRVEAGTATVYYLDEQASPETLYTPVTAPQPFWQFHDRHPFWPDDGYKIGNSFATRGDLIETDDGRHVAYAGGVLPKRTSAASTNIQVNLGDHWYAFRNQSVVGLRLTISSDENIQAADVPTYAPALAMRNWLESLRVTGTGSALGTSILVAWPSGVQFDIMQASGNTLRLESPNTSFTLAGTAYTSIWITFDVESGTPDADLLNTVLQSANVDISGTGQMLENPWGNKEVRGSVRDLIMAGGRVSIPNGLFMAHWKDPDSEIERLIPVGGGFGRTLNYDDLLDKAGGGKLSPRPEGKPYADRIHFNPASSTEQEFHFENPSLLVAYPGADRVMKFHNRGAGKAVLKDWDDNHVITLNPREKAIFSAMFEGSGMGELVSEATPHKLLVYDSTPYFGIENTYYDYQRPGNSFTWRLYQVVDDSNAQLSPLRNDEDAFVKGTGSIDTNGQLLNPTNYVTTPETIIPQYAGQLFISVSFDAEVRGNGSLTGGHSAVLLQSRVVNGTRQFYIHDMTYEASLTGIGTFRSYSIFGPPAHQKGDEYGLFFMIADNDTMNVTNSLRIHNFRARWLLLPEVEVDYGV